MLTISRVGKVTARDLAAQKKKLHQRALYADEVELFEIYMLLRARVYESDRPVDVQSIIAILETYGHEGSEMLSAFRILSRLDNMYIDRVRQTQERERKQRERKVKR